MNPPAAYCVRIVMIILAFMLGAAETSQLAQDGASAVSADRSAPEHSRKLLDCTSPSHGKGHGKGHQISCVTPSSSGVARGDFDGDGFGDLAIGVPNEDLLMSATKQTAADAGQVTVIYGSAIGLATLPVEGLTPPRPSQLWHQDVVGIADSNEAGDLFGSGLASGDFNGDGFSDLAAAVPGETVAGVKRGAIHVIRGSANGLTATGSQFISGTNFSSGGQPLFLLDSLAWGDFNHDGFGDLVVEAADASSGASTSATGFIVVLPGSSSGLNPATASVISIANVGISAGDAGFFIIDMRFSAGDVNGDTFDELVIGKRGSTSGAVEILKGSASGLLTSDRQILTQTSSGLSDQLIGDGFGAAVAVGDFNGDIFADIAIGVPGEDFGSLSGAGEVEVILGSALGADPSHATRVNQDTAGMPGVAESGDEFGAALAAGDFNGDGRKDLAIGVPSENVGSLSNAGAVNVIYGSATGLITTGATLITQDASSGVAEANDQFGSVLTAWNFGGDSLAADLAIGVPSEDVGTLVNAGGVSVIYGSGSGLGAVRQFWTSDSGGVPDTAEANDQFGAAVY